MYLSIRALSHFLNFSSSPPCRTGSEVVWLAGLEPKAEGWNGESGLAEVEPKAEDWNDGGDKDGVTCTVDSGLVNTLEQKARSGTQARKVRSAAGGSIKLPGGGRGRAVQRWATGGKRVQRRLLWTLL